jgi:hypothetical protein
LDSKSPRSLVWVVVAVPNPGNLVAPPPIYRLVPAYPRLLTTLRSIWPPSPALHSLNFETLVSFSLAKEWNEWLMAVQQVMWKVVHDWPRMRGHRSDKARQQNHQHHRHQCEKQSKEIWLAHDVVMAAAAAAAAAARGPDMQHKRQHLEQVAWLEAGWLSHAGVVRRQRTILAAGIERTAAVADHNTHAGSRRNTANNQHWQELSDLTKHLALLVQRFGRFLLSAADLHDLEERDRNN